MQVVRILDKDRTTYEVVEVEGKKETQIKQGPVKPEWKAEAKSLAGLKRIIARHEGVQYRREEPGTPVEEAVADYVREIHPDDLPEHEHDYAPVEHSHPHIHTDFAEIRAELQAAVEGVKWAASEAQSQIATQRVADRGEIFHAIDNLNASLHDSLNTLRNVINAVEARIPTSVPAHEHADTAQAIVALRAEDEALRKRLADIEIVLTATVQRAAQALRTEMQNIQPKGDFVTREEFQALTKRKAEYVLLSTQEVRGKQRWILEEA